MDMGSRGVNDPIELPFQLVLCLLSKRRFIFPASAEFINSIHESTIYTLYSFSESQDSALICLLDYLS